MAALTFAVLAGADAQIPTFTVVHNFSGLSPNGDGGAQPNGLTLGRDGNFYGTTFGGDFASNFGTVFMFTPAGTLTTLHRFSNSDGAYRGGLVASK